MDERDQLIGLRGLALLRAGAAGDKEMVMTHRVAIAELVSDLSPSRSRVLRAVSVDEGYAHWAESYDTRANPTIEAEQRAVESLLRDRLTGEVVDVGAGTGRHTRWLLARGHPVTAVDPSREMLAVLSETAPTAKLVVGDVRDLPLEAECADIVICALVLSHLPDLAAIGELARLLRPGGRLIISNPHPFATAVLGSRAWTLTLSGERVEIPEFAHPLSAYVTAFRAAGLIPSALLEPTHAAEQPLLSREPAVVVWAADRPAEPTL